MNLMRLEIFSSLKCKYGYVNITYKASVSCDAGLQVTPALRRRLEETSQVQLGIQVRPCLDR